MKCGFLARTSFLVTGFAYAVSALLRKRRATQKIQLRLLFWESAKLRRTAFPVPFDLDYRRSIEMSAPEFKLTYVKCSEIPQYLRGGEFYQSLGRSDPSEYIQVPADCFAPTGSVNDMLEFNHLLRTMKFWKLDPMPLDAMKFCHTNSYFSWIEDATEILGEESVLLGVLVKIFEEEGDRIVRAVQADRTDFVGFFAHFSEHVDSKGVLITTLASRWDHVESLKVLHAAKFRWDASTCLEAAKRGSIRCLRYAREHKCVWDDQVTLNASEGGHLTCLQYAIDNGCAIHWKSCRAAASNGHIDCLRLLHQHHAAWGAVAAGGAARHGHFACLQYLHENDCPWDHTVTSDAAHGGHMECLKYALERGCPVQVTAVENAAKKGHLACLRFLLDEGVPMSTTAASDAASGGQAECLALLHERGCPIDGKAFVRAVTGGHRKCLQYLLDHGRTEDPSVCSQAAKGGNLDCLRFLRAHNIPWDSATTRAAAAGGHLETLRYAVDNGCAVESDCVVLAAKARNGSTQCLQFLVEERGLQWSKDGAEFSAALARADFECVKYLVDSGCAFQSVAFDRKSCKGNMKHEEELSNCVAYAIERGWNNGNTK